MKISRKINARLLAFLTVAALLTVSVTFGAFAVSALAGEPNVNIDEYSQNNLTNTQNQSGEGVSPAALTPATGSGTLTLVGREGQIVGTVDYKVGDLITDLDLPPVPDVLQHYDGRWETEKVTLDGGDYTVNVVYAPTIYSVTFMLDGEVYRVRYYTIEHPTVSAPRLPDKAGTLLHWEKFDTSEFRDIVVHAVSTPVYYTVTFFADGEEYASLKFSVNGTPPEMPEVPAKPGYKAVGWETPDFTLAKDQTVHAIYEPIEYTVTFYVGEFKIAEKTFTAENKEIDIPALAAIDGYTAKWGGYDPALLSDQTVKAEYTPITYYRHFYVEGKQVDELTQPYTVVSSPALPAVPSRAGYEGRWEPVAADEGEKYSAVYTAKTYTATFVADGKTVGTQEFTVESTVIPAPAAIPEKFGYTAKWPAFEVMAGDLTVEAVYTPRVCSFVGADGQTVEGTYGNAPSIPHKRGYTGEWVYTDKNGTLTATPTYTLITYTAYVNFEDRTAEVSFTVEVTKDELFALCIEALAIPEKIGYRIVGDIEEVGTVLLFARETAETYAADLRITFRYEKVLYEAIFRVDGEIVGRTNYHISDATLTAPNVAQKTGYTFAWDAYTIQEGGMEVIGRYTPITYYATFVADGETVAVLPFDVTETPNFTVADPVKAGHKFIGWENYELGAADITVNAVFEALPFGSNGEWWLIVAVIAVAIILILLLVLAAKKKKGDDPTPPPANEDPVEPCPTEPLAEEIPETSSSERVEKDPPAQENAAKKRVAVPEGERAAAVAGALARVSGSGHDDEMSTVLITPDGRHILIKYRKSFRARIIQADEECKSYYAALKNYILSFDGITASDSWNYESFGCGRKQFVKMNVTGKTLVLFLALDPAELDGSKYKYDDVGARKRYEKTPVKFKVRSARSFKWAKELVDMTMERAGIAFLALREEDCVEPYASKEELIARKLIEVTAKDMETGAMVDEEEIVNLIANGAVLESDTAIEVVEEVTMDEAHVLMEDSYAADHIKHLVVSRGETATGRMDIINVDTLDANYEAGDTVDLASLKEKGLLSRQVQRVKVLARGRLTKPLTVEANAYSLDAVKMILLTGGQAIELD